MKILYSYFRYTGRLLLWCAVFVACCIIIRALWETKKEKRLSYRKKYKEEFAWETSIFWLHTLSTKSFFVAFFVYSPFQVTYLLYDHNKNTKYFYGWYSVWYGKYEKTSWLASLRKWSYFKLFFSNSYSGYELKLIIKRRIKLLFAFTVFTKVLI